MGYIGNTGCEGAQQVSMANVSAISSTAPYHYTTIPLYHSVAYCSTL